MIICLQCLIETVKLPVLSLDITEKKVHRQADQQLILVIRLHRRQVLKASTMPSILMLLFNFVLHISLAFPIVLCKDGILMIRIQARFHCHLTNAEIRI
jgi:hypothetical protein